ncbi:aflatoxin B1 aldehyde reductase-like protein member 2 [Mycena sp. CBHHK59/15]|nr:aflatoxin B1 aldehyde reductase-like protein member 2 [Mycena sp. CBHHK59/15]
MPCFSPRIPVVYGAGGIGAPGTFCKLNDATAAQSIIDEWCARCGPSAIDTSNLYGFGSSETILAEMDLHGSRVDTKLYPLVAGGHSAANIRKSCEKSVLALKGIKIRVLYLHAPDRATPWPETIKAIDELHKEGHFEEFGLSNYKSYEVAEIVTLCRANGWISPSVYQGVYSAIDRTIETELIPCLRHFEIKFAAYCPLAGGYLIGHILNSEDKIPTGSHFDPKNPFGMWYQERYMGMNSSVLELRKIVEEHGLILNSASVRWLQHHSAMIPSDHGIVFGGSKASHVKQTLEYCMQGPLPEAVVEAYENCYREVRVGLPYYNHDPAWYDPAIYGY